MMMKAIQGAVVDERLQKAFALFADGKSTNGVAAAIYNGNWAAAKKARAAWEGANGIVSTPSKPAKKAGKKKVKRVAEPAPAEAVEDEAPDSLECGIIIPIDRAADISAEFTPSEKATALLAVLQERMDAALAAD